MDDEQNSDHDRYEEPTDVPADIHLDDDEENTEAPEPITNDKNDTTQPEKGLDFGKKPLPAPQKSKKSWFRPEILFIPPLRRKLGRFARPLASLIIVVVILLGGSLVYWKTVAKKTSDRVTVASSFKLPVTAFKLISTIPSNKATNVNTNTDLTLNFNQPVTATKLINNMFITPNVTGTFTQGKNPNQVIFKPNATFAQGTKVTVMVNGTYQSTHGSQLGSPYMYGFTTSIPVNGVAFQDQTGLIDEISSLPSGQKETYQVFFGNNVTSGVNVALYKGDVNDLLNSLVYSGSQSNGETFNDLSVSTTGLQKISSVSNVTNNQSYSVQQPDGLYVAVATDSSGNQLGLVWIDFSDFGVLLRQDDQKVVYDAQTLSDSKDVPANVSFYNLAGSVDLLSQQSINGLTSTNFPFSPSVDLAVATSNGETTITPINIPESGGDIRVDQDLSSAQQVYGITDKPIYSVGQTVQYAGFARNDNDVLYTNPGSGGVNLYVATNKYATPLATFTAQVDANGMFSGSFTPDSSWMNSGDAFDQFQIFASAVDGNPNNDLPVASFTLTGQSNPSSNLTVSFSKTDYLPNDPITATISGTNGSGKPLANTTIQVHIYSWDYYENNGEANLENFGDFGDNELPNSPVTVSLNAQGQATYTINPSSLPGDGNSQYVTVSANLPSQTGVGAAGAASAVIHQGDGAISFGLTRQSIPGGDDLISDVYANHLNTTPMNSTTINYQLVDSSTSDTLASGKVQADSSGFAEIDIAASSLPANGDGMTLSVSTTDEYGNNIQAETYYNIGQSDDTYDTSGAGLEDLNVTGSPATVNVGDTVSLNINAPANIRAMVTYDRGRIYSPSMLNLNQGNNPYSFTVSPNLAPSFTLTFNYFLNGVYHSEGVRFNVNDSSQQAKVSIKPTSQSVTANSPTTIQVNTTDDTGNALPTSMIVDVVSTNAYDLSTTVNPDIFTVLFGSRPIMTSSSSSLSPIGSGGGRCGGGGGGLPSFANAIGTTLFWQSEMVTDSSGHASFSFTPTSGSWTISVYAMSANTQVGSGQTTITAN